MFNQCLLQLVVGILLLVVGYPFISKGPLQAKLFGDLNKKAMIESSDCYETLYLSYDFQLS